MTELMAATDRRRGRIAFWALAGLALLVSHDAIYLAQAGPGEALTALLRTAGHGYWTGASTALAGVALVAGLGAAIRIASLRRRASRIGARPARDPGSVARFARTWARLGVLVVVAFAVQENLEHLIAHGHAPGAGALLGPEYPLALPVIGLVTALAAAIATLVGSRHDALVAAIAAALHAVARAPRGALLRPARDVAWPASVLARRGAGRAPPAAALTSA